MAMSALAERPVSLDRTEAARWRWTNTALDRLAEHPFSELEVMTAVMHPAAIEQALQPALRIYRRGACGVVLDPESKVIITILDVLAGQRRPRRLVLAPPPAPPPPAVVKPAERRSEVAEQVPVDPRTVKNMAERIRLLNAEYSATVPAIVADWMPDVCLPRLRDYPGRWALVFVAPHTPAAQAWDAQIRESHSDLETAVRGVNIYARFVMR